MARKTKGHRSSNEVDYDKHVGQRIRERRVVLGLSQVKLAEGLGISFQQIQNGPKRTPGSPLLRLIRSE